MWNYRVMRHVEEDTVWYGLHEVFYNEKDQICGWTEDSIVPGRESVEELEEEVTMMLADVKKSKHKVLDFDMESEGDFEGVEDDV